MTHTEMEEKLKAWGARLDGIFIKWGHLSERARWVPHAAGLIIRPNWATTAFAEAPCRVAPFEGKFAFRCGAEWHTADTMVGAVEKGAASADAFLAKGDALILMLTKILDIAGAPLTDPAAEPEDDLQVPELADGVSPNNADTHEKF